jgi:non-specific serine/threonine protein kinase
MGTKSPEAPFEGVTQDTELLTRREREVAGLIAQGLTNRQIGEALVIGERTVEMHVSNVLAKLDLSSRAQIAVWAAERLPPNPVPKLRVPR